MNEACFIAACLQLTRSLCRLIGILLQNTKDGVIFKNAHPTQLYFTLIVSAGLMAGLGLAHNSVVVIVASMLVSPLMGSVDQCSFQHRFH